MASLGQKNVTETIGFFFLQATWEPWECVGQRRGMTWLRVFHVLTGSCGKKDCRELGRKLVGGCCNKAADGLRWEVMVR